MRTFEEMTPVLREFLRAMSKYAILDRKAFDFGIGMELFPAEIHMLTAIEHKDGIGVTELAEEFRITKGAVSQLVAKLIKKDLVHKTRNPEHGSRIVIKATDLGRTACQHHVEFHKRHDKELFEYLGQLDENSYEAIQEMAQQMNKWMDSYLK